MTRCRECDVGVEGRWDRCPLCGAALAGVVRPGPFPVVPLRYSRRRLLRVLALIAVPVVLASFAAQILLPHGLAGIGGARSVWLGLASMLLVVITAVRNRRDVARHILHVVVLVCLVTVYWDHLTGGRGWSLTYAVPSVLLSSAVAVVVAVTAMRTEAGEHVLSSGVIAMLCLVPLAFVALGWTSASWPALACAACGAVAAAVLRGLGDASVRHELAKRLNL